MTADDPSTAVPEAPPIPPPESAAPERYTFADAARDVNLDVPLLRRRAIRTAIVLLPVLGLTAVLLFGFGAWEAFQGAMPVAQRALAAAEAGDPDGFYRHCAAKMPATIRSEDLRKAFLWWRGEVGEMSGNRVVRWFTRWTSGGKQITLVFLVSGRIREGMATFVLIPEQGSWKVGWFHLGVKGAPASTPPPQPSAPSTPASSAGTKP
jgi:hypothetical protein